MTAVLAKGALSIDVATGLLRGVRQVLSPHHDRRPSGQIPELLVIHGISLPPARFGGPWIDHLFCGSLSAQADPAFGELVGLRVSAHLLIRRDGSLVQYVPFMARAWHAGVSSWQGRAACNDFSIGIELEGTDTTPYADAQYEGLVEVLILLLQSYPSLSADRIVGHSDIAPGRKSDPGLSFEWDRLRLALAARTGGDI
jgi:AmpD protein